MTWGKLNYNYPKYLAILLSIIFLFFYLRQLTFISSSLGHNLQLPKRTLRIRNFSKVVKVLAEFMKHNHEMHLWPYFPLL